MGKGPLEMIPIKYANDSSAANNQYLNYAIGGAFLALLFRLYRAKHGKGTSGGAGSKKGGSFGKRGGGGGGMQDMMGMSKANVQVFGVDKKIKVRFKHVAGMDNAKIEVTEFVDFLKNP